MGALLSLLEVLQSEAWSFYFSTSLYPNTVNIRFTIKGYPLASRCEPPSYVVLQWKLDLTNDFHQRGQSYNYKMYAQNLD